MKKSAVTFVLSLLLLCGVTAAPLTNGNFEAGTLVPWTGTTAVSVSNATPQEGNFHALIQTTQFQTITQLNLETFLELQAGSLNVYHTGTAVNPGPGGSGMLQMPITVAAGDTISFKWNFLPKGIDADLEQNDVAFYTLHLDGVAGTAANVFTLSSTIISGGNPTGYQTVTTGPLAAGDYVLGFGIYDNADGNSGLGNFFRPDLLIDAVTVIPEPSTVSLLILGLSAGGYCWRRRRS